MDTRSHTTVATLLHPANSSWMAVSFALIGLIIGYVLALLPGMRPAQAQSAVIQAPPPPAVQAQVIRPPDPTAIGQGGGCGGGGAGGGLGCGGAGGGCGAGCGGTGGGCGAIAPLPQIPPTT